MRLKNKKTGEIEDWDFGSWYQAIINPDNKEKHECKLNEFIDRVMKFREEWGDYEEPKVGYIIDPIGEGCISEDNSGYEWADIERAKEIGLWFETKEEAEEAVEKLKAWKRLKDKGFKFGRWQFLDNRSGIWVRGKLVLDIVDELDILFGDEE